MEIEYTPHADFNISERKLNKKTIESIIKNPDKVVESIYERKVAQKVINNNKSYIQGRKWQNCGNYIIPMQAGKIW